MSLVSYVISTILKVGRTSKKVLKRCQFRVLFSYRVIKSSSNMETIFFLDVTKSNGIFAN